MNLLWDNLFRPKAVSELRDALANQVLFRDLSSRELDQIEKVVHVRHYQADETIFREGDLGIGMYIILKGRVEIVSVDPTAPLAEDREIFVTLLEPSDFFGELALVEEGGRRPASAIAREECSLIGFFKPDLEELLIRSPRTGIKIILRLAHVLGHRLKETTTRLSELRRVLRDLRAPPPLTKRPELAP